MASHLPRDITLQPAAQIHLNTMSRRMCRLQIHDTLRRAGLRCHTLHGDRLETLDHFVRTAHPWIGAAAVQEGLQSLGVQLAMQVPSLLHTILAFSSSHLAFLFPKQTGYAVSAAACFEEALQLYARDVGSCGSLGSLHLDGLLGNSLLFTMVGFAQADLGVESQGMIDFGWVATMEGPQALLRHDAVRHHNAAATAWRPVWAKAADLRAQIDGPPLSPGRKARNEVIATTFAQVCEFDRNEASGDANPYRTVVEQLMRLWTKSTKAIVSNLVLFVAGLSQPFVRLLTANDDRAMLIISHWGARALTSDQPQWWIRRKATELCWRICLRLEGTKHPGIRLLLEEPARACGYTLPR